MDKELAEVRDAKRVKTDSIILNLATELLVKILSYLPVRDKIKVRYICRVFRDVSKVPSLWKFIWPDYEPCHVCSVNDVLKEFGDHVRRLSFPSDVGSEKTLEMASYCTSVTHLSLPNDTKRYNLGELEKVIGTLHHLQQLDVFLQPWPINQDPHDHNECIEWFLRITAGKELKLRINCNYLLEAVTDLQNWADQGNPLPSVVNILTETDDNEVTDKLFEFWSASSSKLPSCEIALYDGNRIPINLYPPMPLRKFKFGPAATSPFIQLSSHGIVGLKSDTFYLSEYDHNGEVRHTMIPFYNHLQVQLNNSIPHICSVTSIDFFDVDVYSSQLEQLATACPHLQRLSLKQNVNCLTSLQGLHAVVHTCKNLQGLNLSGISASYVENCLLLWELLSSLKKLTYLALSLCVMGPQGLDDADKQKLISMLKSCHRLRALEICHDYSFGRSCVVCSGVRLKHLLFSHLPSIVQSRMVDFPYSVFNYAVSHCPNLQYFYEDLSEFEDEGRLVPLSGDHHCHLQQLYISSCVSVSDRWAYTLSTHCELESIFLCVSSISMKAIVTLVKNSPNLTVLQIVLEFPMILNFDTEVTNYTNQVKEILVKCKLVAPHNLKVIYDTSHCLDQVKTIFDCMNTNLNSLWTYIATD